MTVELHQVLVGAGRHDAITNMARQLRSELRKLGPSEIFARHPAPDVDDVLPLSAFPARSDRRSLILFHASGGDPDVFRFLTDRDDEIIVLFHNIAPAELFVEVDPERAHRLRAGWDELAHLAPRVVLAVADSAFNAQCLAPYGYDPIHVIPAGLDVAKLARVAPDPWMWRKIDDLGAASLLLFVGQALPHKRVEVLVQTQFICRNVLGLNTALALAGPRTMSVVASAALKQAQLLQTPDVLMFGQISDPQLAALYRHADLFVTASEHEGLCVPILESMAFGVPIVARATSAVIDTVGPAGVLVDDDAGPEQFAEVIAELLGNDRLRSEIGGLGRERAASFDLRHNLDRFIDVLRTVI